MNDFSLPIMKSAVPSRDTYQEGYIMFSGTEQQFDLFKETIATFLGKWKGTLKFTNSATDSEVMWNRVAKEGERLILSSPELRLVLERVNGRIEPEKLSCVTDPIKTVEESTWRWRIPNSNIGFTIDLTARGDRLSAGYIGTFYIIGNAEQFHEVKVWAKNLVSGKGERSERVSQAFKIAFEYGNIGGGDQRAIIESLAGSIVALYSPGGYSIQINDNDTELCLNLSVLDDTAESPGGGMSVASSWWRWLSNTQSRTEGMLPL